MKLKLIINELSNFVWILNGKYEKEEQVWEESQVEPEDTLRDGALR
jgi:hypothetical protein